MELQFLQLGCRDRLLLLGSRLFPTADLEVGTAIPPYPLEHSLPGHSLRVPLTGF